MSLQEKARFQHVDEVWQPCQLPPAAAAVPEPKAHAWRRAGSGERFMVCCTVVLTVAFCMGQGLLMMKVARAAEHGSPLVAVPVPAWDHVKAWVQHGAAGMDAQSSSATCSRVCSRTPGMSGNIQRQHPPSSMPHLPSGMWTLKHTSAAPRSRCCCHGGGGPAQSGRNMQHARGRQRESTGWNGEPNVFLCSPQWRTVHPLSPSRRA